MKKTSAFLLTVCILLSSVCVYAFPNTIWIPLEQFNAAYAAGNDAEIYRLGKDLVSIMLNEPDSQEKTEFLGGKYQQLSRCAERLGLYQEAVEFYKAYLPYAEKLGWTDGITLAKLKIQYLSPVLDIYQRDEAYNPPYYGAKFEPARGVYFGSVYDNEIETHLAYTTSAVQQKYPKKNSTYLMYLEFGDEIWSLGRYAEYFSQIDPTTTTLEFAWNIGFVPDDMTPYMEYITKTIDYLAETNIPVFLRFACEMNVSNLGNDPAKYIKMFQTVASYAKTKQNIAVVWSPADISALTMPMENYYPGDEYVDWIGVSFYLKKYFSGIKDHGADTDNLNTYFACGTYAHAFNHISEVMTFMQENNIQKPVMLSECGVSHYIRPENENAVEWAGYHLRSIYSELLYKYPSIKLINYFNVERTMEENAYELFTSETMRQIYNEAVQWDYLLENYGDVAPAGYRPIADGQSVSGILYAAAYAPKSDTAIVQYYIDGTLVQTAAQPPFAIDLSAYPNGNVLEVVLCSNDGTRIMSKSYTIEKEIKVQYNGVPVIFADQKPVIIEDRTLVPARGVFEAMGMQVNWDEATQLVTVSDSDYIVQLQIGSNIMVVNGVEKQIDVPANTINDRTMIPVRAISEAVGCKVDWNEQEQLVIIQK